VTPDAEGRKLWRLTQQFYERRQHAPAWIVGTDPLPQIGQLVAALKSAANEGLDPHLYHLAVVEQRLDEAEEGFLTDKGFDVDEAGSLDVWLTYLYMKYASDLADGLSDLAHADPRWHIKPEKFDPVGHLEEALRTESVDASLLKLTPENPEYVALRKVLADYKAAAAKGEWPSVPSTLRVKPGQKSPHMAILANRLAATGDYTGPHPGQGQSAVYSPALQEAVERFQRRHGLADDGVIGAGLVAELNVPIAKRIRQLELNLERWRWLPRSLGERYILVNVPEYHLEVREGAQVPLSMRVVVGKRDTPTPIFDDEMTHVVFSPYWNVPPDIAQGETLPEMLKDPGFLTRMNMEIVDSSGKTVDASALDVETLANYRFRQRPGAENALGLVKFVFPNQHNVYLHDTPTDSLFARPSRSFSHGCVRLEQPLALAQYVLRDQSEWTKERIEQAMQSGDERTVKLRRSLPVYLVYWTARVTGDGVVQFRNDVYGIDAQQTALLADRLSRLRKTVSKAASRANAGRGKRATGSNTD
jgi:murein L,D-transpeptidase YcbB/YkuD